MNRKQRRALGRRGAGPPFRSAGNAASTGTLAEMLGVAATYHLSGALVEGEGHYRHILTRFPAHLETHGRLGAVLMAQGKASEAIPHFERVIALKPDLYAAYEDLCRACFAAGRLKSAIAVAGRALELNETAQGKTLFAQCVRDVRFTADNGRIRKLMLRALSEGWDRPRDLAVTCISLIKL